MSLVTIMLIVGGFVILNLLILMYSTLALGRLRTVPKPDKWGLEKLMMAPAEMRASKQLHQACYDNNPQEACVALSYWAWASGEIAVANNLDREMGSGVHPEFRDAILALWSHIDSPQTKYWFGGQLWGAFVRTHPEFEKQRQMI